MTSVGYGDHVPYTYPGKVVIIVASLWGSVMISLIILAVSKVFDMTEKQEKALR